eukprot:5000_1
MNSEKIEEKAGITQYDYKKSLLSNGYEFCSSIRPTLQGHIITAKMTGNNDKFVVIKVGNKILCSKGITIVNNQPVPIKENIINEKNILKRLTNSNPPPYMANYVDYFDDEQNHFLVM